jgi:hypothetical protein
MKREGVQLSKSMSHRIYAPNVNKMILHFIPEFLKLAFAFKI